MYKQMFLGTLILYYTDQKTSSKSSYQQISRKRKTNYQEACRSNNSPSRDMLVVSGKYALMMLAVSSNISTPGVTSETRKCVRRCSVCVCGHQTVCQ